MSQSQSFRGSRGTRKGNKRRIPSQSQSQSQRDYYDLGLSQLERGASAGSLARSNEYAEDDLADQDDKDIVLGLDDQAIGLELNHLNTQYCMRSIMRIILRMNTLFGSHDEEDIGGSITGDWRDDILPVWLTEIRDRLADYSEGCRNVRLFMLRLLLNEPVASIVIPWIPQLLPAVLECCLRDLCVEDLDDRNIGKSYHYFLRDVVFALCGTWAGGMKPSKVCLR